MATQYEDITIAGRIFPAIVVEGVGDSAKVVLKQSLTDYDQKMFDLISDAEGSTFKEKFETFILPNGRTGSYVYRNIVHVVSEYEEWLLKDEMGEDMDLSDVIEHISKRVRFDAGQSLTQGQKQTACNNIGVGNPEVDLVGEYNNEVEGVGP